LTEIKEDYDYWKVSFLYQGTSEKIAPIIRKIFQYLYDRILFTYLFLNFLSLNIHFCILTMKDEKHSVQEILIILPRIKVYFAGEDGIERYQRKGVGI
jgi:hypothetical protein